MKAATSRTYTLDRKVYALEDVVGIPVVGSDGRRLGRVEDFVVYRNSNHPAYAVVVFDAELGLGEELFVVPSRLLAFHHDEQGESVVLSLKLKQLESAPEFDHYRWPDVVNPTWAAEIEMLHRCREVSPQPSERQRDALPRPQPEVVPLVI